MTTDLAVIETFSNPSIAHVVAGLLRDAGIPAHVSESQLLDDWAMCRKAAGMLRTEVLIPRERLEEARVTLASLRARPKGIGARNNEG